jgi:hypothetical protein
MASVFSFGWFKIKETQTKDSGFSTSVSKGNNGALHF